VRFANPPIRLPIDGFLSFFSSSLVFILFPSFELIFPELFYGFGPDRAAFFLESHPPIAFALPPKPPPPFGGRGGFGGEPPPPSPNMDLPFAGADAIFPGFAAFNDGLDIGFNFPPDFAPAFY
jgi:hypothetical protein